MDRRMTGTRYYGSEYHCQTASKTRIYSAMLSESTCFNMRARSAERER